MGNKHLCLGTSQMVPDEFPNIFGLLHLEADCRSLLPAKKYIPEVPVSVTLVTFGIIYILSQ